MEKRHPNHTAQLMIYVELFFLITGRTMTVPESCTLLR